MTAIKRGGHVKKKKIGELRGFIPFINDTYQIPAGPPPSHKK